MNCEPKAGGRQKTRAFTLTEVVISMAVAGMTLGGVVVGYILSSQRAEWSAYSLAANSLAMQRLEQVRAAKWDPLAWPPIDQLADTNFPANSEVLDIPISGTNAVYATNVVTITDLSTNPPLKMIRVDTSWMFMDRGPFTNTVLSYRAPDQ